VYSGLFLQIARPSHGEATVGSAIGMGFSILGRKIASAFGAPNYKFFLTDTSDKGNCATQLESVSKWIDEGRYKLQLDTVFPFTKDGAVALFEASQSGKARGKLVIELQAPFAPTPTLSATAAALAAAPGPKTYAGAVAEAAAEGSAKSEKPAVEGTAAAK
jgi:hypothetical protein